MDSKNKDDRTTCHGEDEAAISMEEALAIAKKAIAPKPISFEIYSSLPHNFHVYKNHTEPCWYICALLDDGLGIKMLKSSHLVIVYKQTGEILYNGSANDEG